MTLKYKFPIDVHTPFGSLSSDVANELDTIGPVWGSDINAHRAAVIRSYTPLAAATPKDGFVKTSDVAYGPSNRQVLDVVSTPGLKDADVIVFVHGGAFVRGSKSPNGVIYDNVPYWFARQGCVAVNMEYRLANEATFPGGADDVALAMQWITENIAGHGGNPRRIFLMGHSAGGTHAATYCCDPRHGYQPEPGLQGLILVSARLRADVHPGNPNAHAVQTYFGCDASRHEVDSPMHYAGDLVVPLMVAVAQYENPYLDLYGLEFCQRVAIGKGNVPRFIQLMRHNHTSIVAHFDTGEEHLGREILSFMDSTRSERNGTKTRPSSQECRYEDFP